MSLFWWQNRFDAATCTEADLPRGSTRLRTESDICDCLVLRLLICFWYEGSAAVQVAGRRAEHLEAWNVVID